MDLSDKIMLTDSGLETTLIYHHKIDLPHFAAFNLLNNPEHSRLLDDYFRKHLELAIKYRTGFVLESVTWRANPDWGYKLGYNEHDLDKLNIRAIEQLKSIREEYQSRVSPLYISGCIGPRSDGYMVSEKMSVPDAMKYHMQQINSFKKAGVDLCTALTINYTEEGLGIVMAARKLDVPAVISFTVETDGKLPGGEQLKEAICRIDAETNNYPLYYMINCAHPTHFMDQINQEAWTEKIRGIRANASCKSHAELDDAVELDSGDKHELANWYDSISQKLPNLKVVGGCCGTDVSHIESICLKVAV